MILRVQMHSSQSALQSISFFFWASLQFHKTTQMLLDFEFVRLHCSSLICQKNHLRVHNVNGHVFLQHIICSPHNPPYDAVTLKETLKTAFLFLPSLFPAAADTLRWFFCFRYHTRLILFLQHYPTSRKPKLTSREEAIILGYSGLCWCCSVCCNTGMRFICLSRWASVLSSTYMP